FAPLLESCTKRAYLSFIATEILCQPTQASSSSSGLVLLAIMRLRSFNDRHLGLASAAPAAAGLQYLPLPYMPSSLLASSVSSLRSASLLGAGALRDNFSSRNFLARSGGSFIPSKRRASSASWVTTAVSFSLACADIVSVSSVMKFSCTHEARLALTLRSSSWSSAFFMKASASATVGAALACWAAGFADGLLAPACPSAVPAASRANIANSANLQIRFEDIASSMGNQTAQRSRLRRVDANRAWRETRTAPDWGPMFTSAIWLF